MAKSKLLTQALATETAQSIINDVLAPAQAPDQVATVPAPAPDLAPEVAAPAHAPAPAEHTVDECMYSMYIKLPDEWRTELNKAADEQGVDMSNYVVRAIGSILIARDPELRQVAKSRRRHVRTKKAPI